MKKLFVTSILGLAMGLSGQAKSISPNHSQTSGALVANAKAFRALGSVTGPLSLQLPDPDSDKPPVVALQLPNPDSDKPPVVALQLPNPDSDKPPVA